ncbi:curli-like amyloid fiber formation chaperone CsgH [Parvularcula oceani]|uniref:curli-like amyloid fiber formation chaperone CsgH n=1 Tax=Parvularcula oceani TaxID=1247963 RepID=UPI0004E18B1A|nr:curli-like amyloid fiber formation chaperone CsgH [Parvularcula oceani]
MVSSLPALLAALAAGTTVLPAPPEPLRLGEVEVRLQVEARDGSILFAPVAMGPEGTAVSYAMSVSSRSGGGRSETTQKGEATLSGEGVTPLLRASVSQGAFSLRLTARVGGEDATLHYRSGEGAPAPRP